MLQYFEKTEAVKSELEFNWNMLQYFEMRKTAKSELKVN